MRLGVIADIHANLPALNAVLDDMPSVDRLVCLGDIVGYGPWPAEAVDIIRDHADLTLKGNHDRYVYRPESAAGQLNEQAVAGIHYAADQLSDEQKHWLLSLNDRSDVFDTAFLAVHSHPGHLDRYVRPDDFPAMREYLDDFRGLLLGHTHIQHMEMVDDRLIVNPGAVGQPRDGDPRAAYAIVDTETLETELHRVEYDIERVRQAVEAVGLPAAIGERLADGS